MKIKTLEICGFKSFPDKTVINFPTGISAIVGPNGCGKSNVIDAMRWIMGEQNVRNLRGRTSEDVIFAGTEFKQPLNMAEVSVTLINDDGRLPDVYNDYSEIMITRRLYRSGESEYRINRHPCRLKDIHDIFMGSGAGKKSFAVIQQGNIGAITDASPEERRFFVEEAAGVTKYKARKEETLKKIEATNENLSRIEDIISEVKRQMDSLSAQAKKAEKYKELQKEITRIELSLSSLRFLEFDGNKKLIEEKITILKNTELVFSSQLSETGAGLAREKLELDLSEEIISKLTSEKFEKLRSADKAESELKHFNSEINRLKKEIEETALKIENSREEEKGMEDEITLNSSELEDLCIALSSLEEKKLKAESFSSRFKRVISKLERKASDMNRKYTESVAVHARLSASVKSSESSLEGLKSRLRRLDEETELNYRSLKELESTKKAHETELEEIMCEMRDSADEMSLVTKKIEEYTAGLENSSLSLRDAELVQKSISTELSTLKKMEESMTGFGDGIKKLYKDSHLSESLSVFADMFIIEEGYERAVEAALGETSLFLFTTEKKVALDSIKLLKDNESGRCGIILPAPGSATDHSRCPSINSRKLSDFVKPIESADSIIGHLLSGVYFIEDLESVPDIDGNELAGITLVTRDGDLIKNGFLFTGGSGEGNAGVFEKKNRIRALEEKLEDGKKILLDLHEKVETAKETLSEGKRELEVSTERFNICVKDKQDIERKIFQIDESLKHARKRSEILSLEHEQLAGELEDIEIKFIKDKKLFSEASQSIEAIKILIDRIGLKREQIKTRTETSSTDLSEIISAYSGTKSRITGIKNQLDRLKKYREESKKRLDEMSISMSVKGSDLKKNESLYDDTKNNIHGIAEELTELSESLDQAKEENVSIKERVRQLLERHDEIQKKIDLIKDDLRNSESDKSQIEIKMQAIETRIFEKYHISMSECLEQSGGFTDFVAGTEMEQNLAALKKKIASLGDVNMTAIREYDELKERFEFLTAQQNDLVVTIEDLQKIIRKINRITQEKFIETFDLINLKLKEVFPLLFGGGKAELIMTDPGKPLETGVELMIHPPGKKLSRLSLLSGGEKALSAIAFIFSVFLIKPASFCIMDEIDAPLDEANVIRFNELVRVIGKNSQILVITHNKKTMEFADVLFGVTMEKKGISKVVSVDFTRGEEGKHGI